MEARLRLAMPRRCHSRVLYLSGIESRSATGFPTNMSRRTPSNEPYHGACAPPQLFLDRELPHEHTTVTVTVARFEC